MKTLMKFSTDWCMPCKVSKPQWDTFKKAHEGEFLFEEVDAEAQPDLTEKYGVRGVPTLLLVEGDTVLKRHVGSYSQKVLESLAL